MRNRIEWNEADEAQLKIDYPNTDMLPDQFESKYGRKWSCLKVKARQLGCKRGKCKVYRGTTYRLPKQEVKDLYVVAGWSTRKIAEHYNCTFPTISALLKAEGVEVKDNVETVRRYELNENYFESIDSHEKAYFLGFIAADGYVNNRYCSLRVILQKDDIEVLNNLKAAIGWTGNVKSRFMYTGGKENRIKVERVDFNMINKKIVDDLNKLGVIQKKSLVLKFPDIDEQYYSSFLLGYFDGDGCISAPHSFCIIGTKELVEKYQQILMKNCELYETKLYQPNEGKNTYKLTYNGRLQLQRIFDFLYKDSPVKLERKYNKFKEILSDATLCTRDQEQK